MYSDHMIMDNERSILEQHLKPLEEALVKADADGDNVARLLGAIRASDAFGVSIEFGDLIGEIAKKLNVPLDDEYVESALKALMTAHFDSFFSKIEAKLTAIGTILKGARSAGFDQKQHERGVDGVIAATLSGIKQLKSAEVALRDAMDPKAQNVSVPPASLMDRHSLTSMHRQDLQKHVKAIDAMLGRSAPGVGVA